MSSENHLHQSRTYQTLPCFWLLPSAPSHWQRCCGPLHVWFRLPWSVETRSTALAALLDAFVNNQKAMMWHSGFREFYDAPCSPFLRSELGPPLKGLADLMKRLLNQWLQPTQLEHQGTKLDYAFNSRARLHLKH